MLFPNYGDHDDVMSDLKWLTFPLNTLLLTRIVYTEDGCESKKVNIIKTKKWKADMLDDKRVKHKKY